MLQAFAQVAMAYQLLMADRTPDASMPSDPAAAQEEAGLAGPASAGLSSLQVLAPRL